MPNPEASGRFTIYLQAGQVFASSEPCAVTTILGSCVAVCLWDPAARVGGVTHYLFPYQVGDDQSSPRFGNVAVRYLIEQLIARGARTERLKAKVFGGACVIEAFRRRENHLGMQNVRLAQKLLISEGIPVIGRDVEGRQSRKLIFHTDDGTAWVRRL